MPEGVGVCAFRARRRPFKMTKQKALHGQQWAFRTVGETYRKNHMQSRNAIVIDLSRRMTTVNLTLIAAMALCAGLGFFTRLRAS